MKYFPSLSFSYRKCSSVILGALQTVGNILSGSDEDIDEVLSYSTIFPALYVLLMSDEEEVLKDTLWVISNIAAGTQNHIQKIIDAKIMPLVIRAIRKSQLETKKRGLWILTNAASKASPAQIRLLVDDGCIGIMCEMLHVKSLSTVKFTLVGLEYILEAGEQLGDLQENPYVKLVKSCGGE